jgi:hypothetical protein
MGETLSSPTITTEFQRSAEPGASATGRVATGMRQRESIPLVTEEPYERIAHVRVCGGAGWATTGSTRNRIAATLGCCSI